MTTIESIYTDYGTAKENSPDYTLDFFARNATQLNNPDSFENENELRLYIALACYHLDALFEKSRFNDTADNADKYFKIIGSKIKEHNVIPVKDDWYYSIPFFKGKSTYKLHDYKTSTPIF